MEAKTLANSSGTKSRGGHWKVGEQKGNTNDMILLATNFTWEHAAWLAST